MRRVGNASSSSGLNDEALGEDRLGTRTGLDRRQGNVSRNGTEASAPLWHGPRLRPAFVAQVLGQVLMDAQAEARERARPAYRQGAQIATGRLLDRGV